MSACWFCGVELPEGRSICYNCYEDLSGHPKTPRWRRPFAITFSESDCSDILIPSEKRARTALRKKYTLYNGRKSKITEKENKNMKHTIREYIRGGLAAIAAIMLYQWIMMGTMTVIDAALTFVVGLAGGFILATITTLASKLIAFFDKKM